MQEQQNARTVGIAKGFLKGSLLGIGVVIHNQKDMELNTRIELSH